jgi:hypothetical protein
MTAEDGKSLQNATRGITSSQCLCEGLQTTGILTPSSHCSSDQRPLQIIDNMIYDSWFL